MRWLASARVGRTIRTNAKMDDAIPSVGDRVGASADTHALAWRKDLLDDVAEDVLDSRDQIALLHDGVDGRVDWCRWK